MNGLLAVLVACLAVANNVVWAVGTTDASAVAPGLLDFGQSNGSQPIVEDGQRFLKDKCQKNSKLDNSYDTVLEAKYQFENCVKSLIDFTVLKRELTEARPTGDVDIVFHKYCSKNPLFMGCLQNFSSSVDECMDKDEKETKQIILNITQAVINFLCYDDGDRLALFYAEGGPDCFINNKEGIKRCVNTTFSKYMSSNLPVDVSSSLPHGSMNSSNVPEFSFKEEQCKSLNKVQVCIVKELENCGELTPSNLIDSLFNFIRKSSPCSKFKKTLT